MPTLTFFLCCVLSIVAELSRPSRVLNWSFIAETGALMVERMQPGLI